MRPVNTPQLHLDTPSSGVLSLSGELSVYAISALWRALLQHSPSRGLHTLDCLALTRIDTSGVALLLDWMREANEQGVNFSIKNIPLEAKSLFEVHGVLELFDNACFR